MASAFPIWEDKISRSIDMIDQMLSNRWLKTKYRKDLAKVRNLHLDLSTIPASNHQLIIKQLIIIRSCQGTLDHLSTKEYFPYKDYYEFMNRLLLEQLNIFNNNS